MKVISRDTNKVANLIVDGAYKFVSKFAVEDDKGNRIAEYDSLEALYSKWKDYEEPKGCWIINILGIVEYTHFRNKDEAEMLKKIGNYFETEKEAKEVVEKFKCWQRLEDKGFRFVKILQGIAGGEIKYKINEESEEVVELLNFLFGGEERERRSKI